MEKKYNINIESNSNTGDIIVHILENKENKTSNYWIDKGNICLKNLNQKRALECYKEAISLNCTESQLYHCYNRIAELVDSDIDRKDYLEKIWRLKTIKKSKKDYARYYACCLSAFIEKEPKLFIIIALLISFVIFGKNSAMG